MDEVLESFLMQSCSSDQKGSILALHKEEDKDQISFFPSENLANIIKMLFLLPNSKYVQNKCILTLFCYPYPESTIRCISEISTLACQD